MPINNTNASDSSKLELASALYGNKAPSSKGGPVSWGVLDGQKVVFSLASLSRDVVGASVATGVPYASDALGTLDVTIGNHISDAGTGMRFLVGAAGLIDRVSQVQFADQIGDQRAGLMQRAGLLKESSYAAAGLASLGFRTTAVAANIQGVSVGYAAPTLLGRAVQWLGQTSMALFMIFFVAILTMVGINTYETVKFKNQLSKAEDPIAFLKKKLEVDPESVWNKLIKKYGTQENVEAALKKEALSEGVKVLKELGYTNVSKEELENALTKLLGEYSLYERGFEIATARVQYKKEAKLGRTIGKEALEALKQEEVPLDLASKVHAGLNKSFMLQATVISVVVFTMLVLIGSLIFTGGIPAVAVAVGMLIASVAILGLDTYGFIQSSQGGPEGKYDRILLIISTIFALVSAGVMIGLVAGGLVSMGPAGVAILATITALWLGQNGLSWAKLDKNARQREIDQPTLKGILSAVERGDAEPIIEKMCKNLGIDLGDGERIGLLKQLIIHQEREEQERVARIKALVNQAISHGN